jgi:hypothetical protein
LKKIFIKKYIKLKKKKNPVILRRSRAFYKLSIILQQQTKYKKKLKKKTHKYTFMNEVFSVSQIFFTKTNKNESTVL